MTKEDTVWLVKQIFGKEASKNEVIVDSYKRVNETAMDEYAKQEAIAFAEWIKDEYEWYDKYNCWIPKGAAFIIEEEHYTTEQLYQLFLNQSK